MSVIDDILARLPSPYKRADKSPLRSNIIKMLTLPAEVLQEIKDNTELIGEWRDIDTAEGTTLDRIGQNVQQDRGGLIDATYRQWIKAKIASNTCQGDIDSIQDIISVIVPVEVEGSQEGWTFAPPDPIPAEPAALLIRIGPDVIGTIPFEAVDQIMPAGVILYWSYTRRTKIALESEYEAEEGNQRSYQIPLESTFIYVFTEPEDDYYCGDIDTGEEDLWL